MSRLSRSSRRVVITGLGVICPLGNTKEALWEGLVSGRSGVAPLRSLPGHGLPMSFGGEARDFTGLIDDFGKLEGETKKAVRKALKLMCRECQMGVAAAQRAISDAAVAPEHHDPERCGVVFGADYMLSQPEELAPGFSHCTDERRHFDFSRWGVEGLGQLSPLWLLKYLPNMPASHVAIYNDFRGPNNSITLREAAGNLSIGEAARYIQRGDADLMVAGATGTRVHPMKVVHSAQQEEIAANGVAPERASRPFDLRRTGMVVGEGAGVVVLESLESAQARGATIYAEILGSNSSVVADRRGVARRDAALANVIRGALRDGGLTTEAVGHIHAHGLSTRTSDSDEARAIREAFGARADELPVTAAKSYFGNLGAGSGVVELIASVLALRAGRLFSVLNFESPDPDCPIRVAQGTDISAGDSFLNLSVTPQGQASAVLVGKY